MQSTDQPDKISIPFANSGVKRPIPNVSQIGITDGAASFPDGFPPLTFLPLTLGGVPPAGADFNGILNRMTDIQRWHSAGGMFIYDAAFAAEIGGYPKGARLIGNGLGSVWFSTVENNVTDPDSVGAAGWRSLTDDSGANLINLKLSSIGSATRTVAQHLNNAVYLSTFTGWDATGATEQHGVWQAALTATCIQGAPIKAGTTLVIDAGTYKISDGLTVGAYQNVVFAPGVIIDATAFPNETTSLFNISNQDSVYMDGNGCRITGSKAIANPAVEGNSCAFFLFGTSNCHVNNFFIQDFATDGITIDGDAGASGPCTNIVIENCFSTGNRRDAMSIISVKGLTVIGGEYNFSAGAPNGPHAGIDIEPNDNSYCEGVMLLNVRTTGNAGAGIQLTPGAMSVAGATSPYFDVSIIGGRSLHDGTLGAPNIAALLFANGGTQLNKVYGQINIKDFVVDSPKGRGVTWFNWDADKVPRTNMDNVTVFDPNYLNDGTASFDKTGFDLLCETSHATSTTGNIIMRNCRAVDRRATAWMTWGMVINTDAGKQIKNVTIIDQIAINQAAGVNVDVNSFVTAGPGGSIDLDIVYSRPTPVNVAGSTVLTQYAGKRINVTSSALALTLPTAATCQDMHWEIQNAPGITNTTLTPASGDTIVWLANTSSLGIVLGDGAYISLRSRGGTTWVAEVVSGQTWQAGTSTPGRIYWGIAAPVAGTYSRGDRTLNVTPAVGSPKEWICTVSGTPGTWVSAGNL